ncbi:RDD family protein [Mycobacterium intermedium]|uniref:RDD family protein n=1 Tax=Mycobacterium intermedium TaxID=28445 RepID=A0A1E3SGC2_MYCIE|nr:RDD family protein [Mycobacterium intermedium]MCV6965708.1 RDD family protein [Mycobacterium intermedium]ODR01179.1 hypothetical protein BHQ20_09590 [Mycobacterium intermedium]OPE48559.1 RDD family protein [Mycobacterium intermedium]ORB00983.1 RDD family protein [Mycobacterium intermedium]
MTTGDDRHAPVESVAPSAQRPARVSRRLAARVVDGVIIGIALTPLVYLLRQLTDIESAGSLVQQVVAGLLLGVGSFAYYVVFEVKFGWTPGKKLLGLAVRGPGGAPKPDVTESAVRNSFNLLWIVPSAVGAVLVILSWIVIADTINRSPSKQGIHDRWAGGTQVVRS